jgi:DNA-binding beta-propeller fold protein YncE
MATFTPSLAYIAIFSAGSLCQAALTVTEVAVPINDIVYDPVSDRILASLPSRAGAQRGNTITPIDPYTGALGTSVFVASEPNVLALADDGSRLYVASNSTNTITPFSLSTMTPGVPFPIGVLARSSSGIGGAFFVRDFQHDFGFLLKNSRRG